VDTNVDDDDDDLPMDMEPVQSVDDHTDGRETSGSAQKPDYSVVSSSVQHQQLRNHRNICRICDGKVFASNAELQHHRVSTHRRYSCQMCCAVLIGRPNFVKHVHKEHPGLPVTQVSVACCGGIVTFCVGVC